MTLQQLTLAQIASLVNGEVKGDDRYLIGGLAGFSEAEENQITFAGGAKYLKRLSATRAGAVLVPRNSPSTDRNVIEVDHPQLAFIALIQHWYPAPQPSPGIHPTAVVAQSATLEEGVEIGPHCVLGETVHIGRRVQVKGQVNIGDGVTIGAGSVVTSDLPSRVVAAGNPCRVIRKLD